MSSRHKPKGHLQQTDAAKAAVLLAKQVRAIERKHDRRAADEVDRPTQERKAPAKAMAKGKGKAKGKANANAKGKATLAKIKTSVAADGRGDKNKKRKRR